MNVRIAWCRTKNSLVTKTSQIIVMISQKKTMGRKTWSVYTHPHTCKHKRRVSKNFIPQWQSAQIAYEMHTQKYKCNWTQVALFHEELNGSIGALSFIAHGVDQIGRLTKTSPFQSHIRINNPLLRAQAQHRT